MIKSLQIQNFQSHRDSFIEFDPFVTAFIGLNNHGKSAILKSLYKIVRNAPEGTTFINDNCDEMSITLTTDKGTVRREVKRNSDSGKYVIVSDISPAHDIEFVKFSKTGIPQEVLNIFDISETQDFGNVEYDLNFHRQQDLIFLIKGDGLSSIRSKVLCKITGTDVVQRAIQHGKTKESGIQQDLKYNYAQKQDIQQALQKFNYIDNLHSAVAYHYSKIERLTSLENTLNYYSSSYQKLLSFVALAKKKKAIVEKCVFSFDESFTSIKNKYKIISQLQKLKDVNDRICKKEMLTQINITFDVQSVSMKLKVLSLLTKLYNIEKRINKLSRASNVNIPDLTQINILKDSLSFYNKKQSEILSIQEKINLSKVKQQTAESSLLVAEQELQQYKQEIGLCPTCGKPF